MRERNTVQFARAVSSFLIFCFVVTNLPVPLHAHDGYLPSGVVTGPGQGDTNPDADPPPDDKAGAQGDPTCDTDPVLYYRGDFKVITTDLVIPGRGMPLEIKRTYRSRSRYNAMFGYGWDFSFNIRLRKRSNGDIVILTGENRRNEFKKEGTTYTPPPGIYDTLTQEVDGSFKLTKKYGTVYSFDLDGKLISIQDRNSNTITFTYDPQGKLPVTGTSPYFVGQTTGIIVLDWRLIKITDTVGRDLNLFYDSNGRLEKIKDFTGRILTYQYSPEGDLTTFADTLPSGLLPGETLMGYKTAYSYTSHNLETITDAKGKTYLINVYNNEDRVTEQTYGDPLESGGTSAISYDPLAGQTTVIDRKGFKTIHTFDSDGNPVRREFFTQNVRPGDPASYLTQYEYNSNLELTKTISPKGNITENAYDSKGNLTSVSRKGTGGNPDLISTFTYEPNFNQIKTVTDPRGNVTTYTYDYELGEPSKGNLRKITFPAVNGQTIESLFTYTSFGELETVTDPNGNITKYEYFPLTGYLKKITQGFNTPDASTTEFTYDSIGNVSSVKDPRGNTATFQYDVNSNLKQITNPKLQITKYTYDPNGNLEKLEREAPFSAEGGSASGGGFQTTTYSYTSLDQLKSITDHQAHVTAFEYDPNGNRKKVTDAEGNITQYTYDERDLLYQVTDAESHTTAYSYDANGNLETIKDANTNVTSYQYDEFDRLKKTIYPDSSEEVYTYDSASNLTEVRSPKSEVRKYAYDELNRLKLKEYVGCPVSLCGGNVTYQYDQGSRLKLASNSLTTLDYQYDSLNHVKVSSSTLNAQPYTLSSQYDTAGNRIQLTYPHGQIVKYDYDTLNRLDKIKTASDTVLYDFGYDSLSRRDSLTRPNGITTTYAYDTLNRLMEIGTVPALPGTVPISYPLYDKVGNRKQKTDSSGTETYSYDKTYQLTSVSGGSSSSYTYDPVGNRLTAVIPAQAGIHTYTPNSLNQYASVDSITYSYDLNGNLTSDGTRTYEYDYENRLVKSTVIASASEAIYAYDPFGRRLSSSLRGGAADEAISYLYDGDQIIEVFPCSLLSALCSVSQSYLHGPGIDEPLEITNHPSQVTSYYHSDGLGSVTALTSSSGSSVETYTYDAYGIPEIRNSSGSVIPESLIGNPFTFTAREYDPETGLYYYRERYYYPQLGRFLNRDGVDGDDENRYTYVENNSINYVDPYGEFVAIPIPFPGPIGPHGGPGIGGIGGKSPGTGCDKKCEKGGAGPITPGVSLAGPGTQGKVGEQGKGKEKPKENPKPKKPDPKPPKGNPLAP
jgi:RHS repeat-associated protein